MRKRFISTLFIFLLIIFSLSVTASVALGTTLNLSVTTATVGEMVTASGISDTDAWITVKGVDDGGNIKFLNFVKSDTEGNYSCTFKMPAVENGILRMVGGYGSTVAIAELTVGGYYYSVTYYANGATGTAPTESNKAEGTSFIAAANNFAAPSGKQFKEWNTNADGTGTSYLAGATVIMPGENLTLYAIWTSSGNQGSDTEERGGGGSGTPASTPITHNAVITRDNLRRILQVNVNTQAGSAAVNLGALARDIFVGEGTAIITMPSIHGVKDYTLVLLASSLSNSQGKGKLTFSTDSGSITIPGNMLSGVEEVEGKEVGISIGEGDKTLLPDAVREALGNRPLVQLTLTVDTQETEWNNPDAPVTVSIPYTPTAQELANLEQITVWYIDGSGNVVEVPSGRYDPDTGMVTFTTTHFSNYGVVYVTKTFNDLGSVAWAKKQIEVLASKGVLKGITETEYAPQENITRADFLYFLVRTLGVDAKIDGNFHDIDKNTYYYKEIAIAKKLGMTTGIGNNKFNPNASITRQDMMVLTERALRMQKKLKTQGTATDLEMFSDKSLVAAYAVKGVASVVDEGLIVGSADKVNPLGNTTRAEAAVFLYRIYNKY